MRAGAPLKAHTAGEDPGGGEGPSCLPAADLVVQAACCPACSVLCRCAGGLRGRGGWAHPEPWGETQL